MTVLDPPEVVLATARAAVAEAGWRWGGVRGRRVMLQPGRRRTHVLDLIVLTGPTGRGVARPATLVLTASPLDAAGPRRWWLPHDPALPGLAAALDPVHVADWLGGLGPLRERRPLVYRPRERAVVAVAWSEPDTARPGPPARAAFLKVLPLHAVHPVHRRLRAARAAGVPVPPPLAPPEAGVLALGRVPGVPWRSLLAGPAAAALDPGRITELLGSLPPALISPDDDDPPARSAPPAAAAAGQEGWAGLLEHAAWAAAVLDVDGAAEVARTAERARVLLARGDAGARVPVHGDLHPGNLHVDAAGERILGLLDADTLGAGHRVDDWAALLGHLAVAAADLRGAGRDASAAALEDVAARHRARAERETDPVALAARAGVTALALSAVPEAPAAVCCARRRAAGALLGSVGAG